MQEMLKITGIRKSFSTLDVLKGVDLTVHKGEVVSLIGPSGSGKTTLLRILLGLERPDSGTVEGLAGRRISAVFQEDRLLEHLSAEGNLRFVLGRDYDARAARALLDRLDLPDTGTQPVREFSGGMKQRVAIARAYAVNPKVLLMDEPFGALDAQTRTQLQQELLNTWEKEQKTCFFITHDVEEAIILAQRVVIMCARPGRVKEIVDIDIPYPRDQETKMSPRFLELKNHIWSQVYQEYLSVRK